MMRASSAACRHHWHARRRWAGPAVVFLAAVAIGAGCAPETPGARAGGVERRPPQRASQAFWRHWSDGRAELSGYRVVTPRYGQLRTGTAVLIYVTEDMNRTTLIKDDTQTVPEEDKQAVMKLNHMLKFRTGLYPYSVMTSVFAPVESSGRERFAPVKVTFSAQEWCGHVFHTVKPTVDRFWSEIRSYFSVEGERSETVATEPFALYEDALLIQLRELDGPFEGGGDWSGQLVPSLWRARKSHQPLLPVAATISRRDADRDGVPVNRFQLTAGEYTRTFDVEKAKPHRILGWTTSEGEEATLLETTRLAYWQLNQNGAESYLTELGLGGDEGR